jgi:ferrous-iron efflux pump FieF
VRLTGSRAIAADRLHYTADLATNLSVMVSLLVVARTGWLWLDPLIGLAVAVYLGSQAYAIGREAVRVLMDHELPAGDRERIRAIVLAHAEVRDMHDLRTRESARRSSSSCTSSSTRRCRSAPPTTSPTRSRPPSARRSPAPR